MMGYKQKIGLTDDISTLVKQLSVSHPTHDIWVNDIDEICSKLQISRIAFCRRMNVSMLKLRMCFTYSDFRSGILNTKQFVTINCDVCHKWYTAMSNLFIKRNCNVPLCGTCYFHRVMASAEYREKNSKAQLIAQNKKETLERQSCSQKKRYEDGAAGKRLSISLKKMYIDHPEKIERLSLISIKRWKDDTYANNVLENSRKPYSGSFNGIFYQSSFELAFILWQYSMNKVVKRWYGPVKYNCKAGKERSYRPDFIVDDCVFEIKGNEKSLYWDADLIDRKLQALKVYCDVNGLQSKLVCSREIPHEFRKKAMAIIKEKNNAAFKQEENSV